MKRDYTLTHKEVVAKKLTPQDFTDREGGNLTLIIKQGESDSVWDRHWYNSATRVEVHNDQGETVAVLKDRDVPSFDTREENSSKKPVPVQNSTVRTEIYVILDLWQAKAELAMNVGPALVDLGFVVHSQTSSTVEAGLKTNLSIADLALLSNLSNFERFANLRVLLDGVQANSLLDLPLIEWGIRFVWDNYSIDQTMHYPQDENSIIEYDDVGAYHSLRKRLSTNRQRVQNHAEMALVSTVGIQLRGNQTNAVKALVEAVYTAINRPKGWFGKKG